MHKKGRGPQHGQARHFAGHGLCKAQEGDRGTIEILEDMGLSQVEDAEGRKTFSLQAIAEMLGMDSDTSWQHQMEDYRKKHELE